MPEPTPDPALARICSAKKCPRKLPPINQYKWNSCDKCRERDRELKRVQRAAKKREREEEQELPRREPPEQPQEFWGQTAPTADCEGEENEDLVSGCCHLQKRNSPTR